MEPTNHTYENKQVFRHVPAGILPQEYRMGQPADGYVDLTVRVSKTEINGVNGVHLHGEEEKDDETDIKSLDEPPASVWESSTAFAEYTGKSCGEE